MAVIPPVKLVQRNAGGNGSGHRRDQRAPAQQKGGEDFTSRTSDNNLEYLDIPAFLRRRAD
ncbi:MAG: hypothetical protein H6969_07890 [Gammaproteobacteria bacterium]|nr:hypothetical protein [Gammaproteobacteria bacterium]